MVQKDSLGDRIKAYEARYAPRFLPTLPVIARIDGKAFHTWTTGLERPYDRGLMDLFQETTKYLIAASNARVGYTQSDEITLIFWEPDPKSSIFFDGKQQKLVSVLASLTTEFFNRMVEPYVASGRGPAHFDCRVFDVPSLEEATNVLIWREQDATRNSIQSAARAYMSHKQVHGMDVKKMQFQLLTQYDVNWNDYPADFKRGAYFARRRVSRRFTTDEISLLPAKHEARRNPNLMVDRSDIQKLDLPPLAQVKDRVTAIFGEEGQW